MKNLNATKRWSLIAAALVPTFFLYGCPKDGALEEAGESIDEGLEDTGEALEDAGEEVEDAVDGN